MPPPSYGRLAVVVWLWSSGCGRLAVDVWLWTSGCGRLAVDVWLWTSGCGRLAVDVNRRSSLDLAGSHPQLIETLPELQFPFPQNMGQKGQKESADAQPVCLIVLFVPTFDVISFHYLAGGRRSLENSNSKSSTAD